MPRDLLDPPTLHTAPGYSHVAVARVRRMAFVAGQVALDPAWRDTDEGPAIIGDSLYEQTKAALENVKRALDALGAGWSDVARRTIYTLHPTEWVDINRAIDEVTGGAGHPAQTIVGVAGLALDGLLIEIECTVILD